MPLKKTNNLLPEIFRTNTNSKFLSATLDQLVTEPEFKQVSGYIGRKFAPGFKGIDTYIKEPTALRADYQLEPSVVYNNRLNNQTEYISTYPEILQRLVYNGGDIRNQNNLWSSEYYTFNPQINYDKFINFSQYYWLPDGPMAVNVFAGQAELDQTFVVTRQSSTGNYTIFGNGSTNNPDLVLIRGGNYRFNLNQSGYSFYIQTEPGISGYEQSSPNISTRQILGVENNGTDSGTVTFNVPLKTAQEYYQNMPYSGTVDLATDLTYSQLQNTLLSTIVSQFNGIDGQQTNLNGKYLIFTNYTTDAADWTSGMTTVPQNQRYGIWQITLTPSGLDYIISLSASSSIPVDNRVKINLGIDNANTEWYKNASGYLSLVPVITADLEYLYYQDATQANAVGRIRLVDYDGNNPKTIDVETDILGKTAYTSPNGIIFTNGLKVTFDSSVVPEQYQNQTYYVYGVGQDIVLVDVVNLEFDSNIDLTQPDFLTVSPASRDLNAWSRRNRWFNYAVLQQAASYNNVELDLSNGIKATRPIIEFLADLQLFDFGKLGLAPIDHYDISVIDPLTDVVGRISYYVDEYPLLQNDRVVFSKAADLEVRNKIYRVNFVELDEGPSTIVLEPVDTVTDYNTVYSKLGRLNGDKTFYFVSNTWKNGQQKLEINQTPMFDVIDSNGFSLGDRTLYPLANSTTAFNGTKIFGYAETDYSVNDPVLGFPISYRSINNIGDIEFYNYFDNQIFEYIDNSQATKQKINLGYLVKNNLDETISVLSVWSTVTQDTTQSQLFSFTYDGINNYFVLDIQPKLTGTLPTIKVFVNYNELPRTAFNVFLVPNNKTNVTINSTLRIDDRINIEVISDQVSNNAFYEIPDNLNLNAKNDILGSVTLGSLRNHIQAITQNSELFFGTCPGVSNLRDIDIANKGGTIVQQSAPVVYSGLFLNNKNYNFVDSVINASQEYARFKNKFLNLATSLSNLDYTDVQGTVDTILSQINQIKDNTFPWYYSDMIPYGVNKKVISYTVFDVFQRNYEITSIFTLSSPSNRAVLVYLNNVQLVHLRDYTFLSNAPAISLTPDFSVAEDDVITIIEYYDTDGCFVPETPSKLGLYPKYIPQRIIDSTYLTATEFIKGHDGSLTPIFDDYRDDLLLELEKRIYNNIKVEYTGKTINIYDVLPGKYRSYTNALTNWNNVLSKYYLQWTGLNNLNYVINNYYNTANPFTYNYGESVDSITGNNLQGSWRACYLYFYDCLDPSLRPWEMLGFADKPDWWEIEYGPAPYTSGNQILWQDLENGYIRGGSRQGYDERFARPGLSEIIPINQFGELKPPLGLITNDFNSNSFDKNWTIGQLGATEFAWRNSSEYAFAVQIAYATIHPAKYFSFGINSNNYVYNSVLDQYLLKTTNFRIRPIDIELNGYINTDQTITRSAGYLNWISDFLTGRGILDKTDFLNYIRYFDVNLVYKVAGYTSKEYIKVLAEQFSPESINTSIIVPDSDFELVLHKSAPLLNARYSGVIVEKTSNGFVISGYDVKNPYFNILLPNFTGESEDVSVLKNSVTWFGTNRNRLYRINYGTEFTTNQQIANFLSGYQQFLQTQGFQFNTFDENLSQIRDFKLSLKEFLFWVQQGWGVNSVIVLSPFADTLNLQTANTIVDEITGSYYGNKVLNQNFLTLDTDSFSVSREETKFKLNFDRTSSDLIGLADLDLVQYEHCIVFKNKTSFNDIIYDPTSGSRQFRLKLIGQKTTGWNGTIFAPGFIYANDNVDEWRINTDYLKSDLVQFKNQYYTAKENIAGSTSFDFKKWLPVSKDSIRAGLLRNFATNSVISEDFYDVNKINLEDQFDKFSLGLIGYRERTYLTDAGLDDTSQVKLYQGFIKQKGTRNSINAVENIRLNDEQKTINIAEDWAFRLGSYGSLQTNQYAELILDEDFVLNNPNSLEVYANGTITYSSLNTISNQVYKTASVPWNGRLFLDRTENSSYVDDIETAGYVNIEDIDYTIFDFANPVEISNIINTIGIGKTIWVAKDLENDWQVYRIFGSYNNAQITKITKETGSLVRINTDLPHQLIADDLIVVKNIEFPEFNSLYTVTLVDSTTSFVAIAKKDFVNVSNFTSENLLGQIYRLQTVKLDRASQISSLVNYDTNWIANSKVWVNNNDSNGWAVYNKSNAFESNLALSVLLNQANARLGSSLAINSKGTFFIAGEPGYGGNVGSVATYAISVNNTITENLILTSTVDSTVEMGHSVSFGNIVFTAGSPLSNASKGYVFVYDIDFLNNINFKQILAPNTANTSLYGYSTAISKDDNWLYVGAPADDRVYAYQFKANISQEVDVITADGILNSFTLGFTPESALTLFVSNSSNTLVRNLVPYKEFDVSGSVITFTDIPAAGQIVVRQTPGYVLANVIQSANTTIRFGESIACTNDGAQVVIGAPKANLTIDSQNYTRVGRVDVYDRSIQNFIANGIQSVYTTLDSIKSISRVSVNGITSNSNSYTISTNTLTFNTNSIPAAGSIVSIETNTFKNIQSLIPDDAVKFSNANLQFGHSVDICSYSCSIYVGAPNYSVDVSRPYVGAVYSYLNQGRLYGTITSSTNASVISGQSLRINDYAVTFGGSNVNAVVANINSAAIPGISASNVDNAVVILSNAEIATNRLRILPGSGEVIEDLGLDVFKQTQKILNPDLKPYDYFGSKIKISTVDPAVVGIGSEDATAYLYTTFDLYSYMGPVLENISVGQLSDSEIFVLKQNLNLPLDTSFDNGSTKFRDYVAGSGASWVYNYLPNSLNNIDNPGLLTYSQQLLPRFANGAAALGNGIKFGSDLIFSRGFSLVGARYDNTVQTSANSTSIKSRSGKIYRFNNPDQKRGWDVLRNEELKVDIDSIIKSYVYSVKTNNIIDSLDYIDPAKGKILGIAEQDINYKTDYDPAVYNQGSNLETTIDNKFYWSTNQVGQVWWDLSTVRYIDYEQGSIKYRNSNWGRTFPGSEINVYEWVESLYPPSLYKQRGGNGDPKHIDNSAYSSITYIDPGTNSPVIRYYFWVKNKTSINSENTARKITVSNIENYIRDPKNSGVKFFAPLRYDAVGVYNLNTDLSGKDKILHIDYTTDLNDSTLIHNEYQLISESAKNVNQIPQNVYNKMIDSLSRIDSAGNPVPDPLLPVQTRYGIELRPRQSVFIDQNKAVREMVEYTNSIFKKYLMAQGFDLGTLESKEPEPLEGTGQFNIKVNTVEELYYLNIAIYAVGFKVLVASDSTAGGLWTIYTKKSNNTWLLTKVQSYDVEEYWQYEDWYISGYNTSVKPKYTVETIVDLINLNLKSEDIVKINNTGSGKWALVQVYPTFTLTLGIEDGTIKLKDSLYDLENNFMGFSNERFSVDRFDKNPSIELRKILQAIQNDLFINQLSQDFVNLFFVLVKYAHNEQQFLDWVFKTSFITVNQAIKNLNQPKIYYKENQNLYQSYIEEVKPYRTTIREFVRSYDLNDNLNGYVTDFDLPATYDPVLQIYRSPSGEYTQDSELLTQPQYYDWNQNYYYFVGNISVGDSGSGYTIAPNITITGSTINDDARATAIISGGSIISVVVDYPGSYYFTQPNVTLSGGNGSGGKIYAQLVNNVIRKLKTTLVYDRVNYDSSVLIWQPNTAYYTGNLITYNDKAYQVTANFTSNSSFIGNNLEEIYANSFSQANDRIRSFYSPDNTMPGKDFSLLQSGIDYPGVIVEGLNFDDTGGFDTISFDMATFDPVEFDAEGTPITPPSILDTIIESSYTDTELASRDGAIIIDGSQFVDQYSSHAPEELIPGRIFDSLDLTVTTFATNAASASYTSWLTTTAFYVDTIEVLDGGFGYDIGDVAVTISGGDGSGATASAVLDSNGVITSISVDSAGSGYTSIPNVIITGTNVNVAVASVILAQSTYDTFSYKIIKDKNENYQYLRLQNSAITTLTADLSLTASSMTVSDSSKLPVPTIGSSQFCSVVINGERIIYLEKDDNTNTLSRLIRGSYGTGANAHSVGSEVVDAGYDQIIPYGQVYNWTPNVNTTIIGLDNNSYEFYSGNTYIRSNAWINLWILDFLTTENQNRLTTENDLQLITDNSIDLESNGLFMSNLTPAVFIRQS